MTLAVQRTEGWDREPDVGFTLELARALTAEELALLQRLLSAWYLLGTLSAFGGHFHDITELNEASQDDCATVEWFVDFGAADIDGAVELLIRCIGTMTTEVPVRRLVLGARFVS